MFSVNYVTPVTNLKLNTRTDIQYSNPQVRGQESLGQIEKLWQIKMMTVLFFIAHDMKRVLNFMRNTLVNVNHYCSQ